MLVSGDRASEVEYLASIVGITEVFSSQSPEQKLDIVRAETANAKTIFVGDGINVSRTRTPVERYRLRAPLHSLVVYPKERYLLWVTQMSAAH